MINIMKNFSKAQQDTCRDIRRRGKNKFHALKCRQKSKDELLILQEKVKAKRHQKKEMMKKHTELSLEKATLDTQLLLLEIDSLNQDFC